jgi:DDE superfamily endonuclease
MADGQSRFAAYVQRLAGALGHADRAGPLRAYCTGLLLPGERKSVEPMAAELAPRRVGAAHQATHHFVAKAPWDDWAMLAAVRDWVLPRLTARGGPPEAWIVDDTGIPKKGRHSVGVARQYCGQVGKQDNCQVAVSLSVATAEASLPIAWRLYLPREWAEDPERRGRAGVPEEVGFATKPAIALGQIEAALAAGVPRPEAVVMDAGYGADTALRDALTSLGLPYVAGAMGSAGFRPAGYVPLPPEPYGGRGRRPSRLRRPPGDAPTAARDLARLRPAGRRLADGDLARGHARALRRDPGAPGAPRCRARHPPPGRVAAGRVAQGRGRAHQVPPLHPARAHPAPAPRLPGQAALADRARLRGPEAGGRIGPLRGARLARLPPPRHPRHRRLRLPGRRAGGGDPPLGAALAAEGPGSSARLRPARPPGSGLSATTRPPPHRAGSPSPPP